MSGRVNMQIMYYYTSFFLSQNHMFSLLLKYGKSPKEWMRQQLIGTHPYTPFYWLMTLPEKKRRKAAWENMGMVVEERMGGNNEKCGGQE